MVLLVPTTSDLAAHFTTAAVIIDGRPPRGGSVPVADALALAATARAEGRTVKVLGCGRRPLYTRRAAA